MITAANLYHITNERSKPFLYSEDSTEKVDLRSDNLVRDFTKYLFVPKTAPPKDADKPLKRFSISRLNAHLSNTVIYKSDNKHAPHFSGLAELFNRLNTEASTIKLEDDPVINMIKETELSETIITIQSDFKKKGLVNFSHEIFKKPLSNILIVLRAELNRHNGDVSANSGKTPASRKRPLNNRSDASSLPQEMAKIESSTNTANSARLNDKNCEQCAQIILLQKEVAELHDAKEPPSYRKVLILSLRYALMISVFKSYPYVDSKDKVNTMREINEHNYDDHKANESFHIDLNKMLGFKGVDYEGLACASILAYLMAIDAPEDGPDYLMLPCFDELDVEFFIKSTRYNIHPAGLLKGNIVFHDDTIFRCAVFMEHDFQHALSMFKYKNYKIKESMDCISLNQDQEILTEINDMLKKINDKNVADSVEKCIFYFTHENLFFSYSSLPLSFLKSKGFLSDKLDKKGILYGIVSGYYEFDEGCTIKHVKQACELLNEHFPTQRFQEK